MWDKYLIFFELYMMYSKIANKELLLLIAIHVISDIYIIVHLLTSYITRVLTVFSDNT